MTDFETELEAAGAALNGLVEGPGREAAEILEQAFGRTGQSIERALGQAARSGELDFKRMAERILADLARIAAEAVVANSLSGPAQTLNLNMSLGAGADVRSVAGAAGAIATAIAGAAARGGRFA